MMLYQRVPSDLLTETSRRGQLMSVIAMVSISILFLFETKAYFFSTILETDLAISRNDETLIQLNFDITMMDLPCDQAAIDVYTAVGFEKKITKNMLKNVIIIHGLWSQLLLLVLTIPHKLFFTREIIMERVYLIILVR